MKNYYYRDLLPGSNEIVNKDLSISLLSHIKINPLKALLSAKINTAHSQGINVTIEIMDDIDFINMHIIDICRIIGIFMDNAIEGSLLCDNKFIHVAVIKTDDNAVSYTHLHILSLISSLNKVCIVFLGLKSLAILAKSLFVEIPILQLNPNSLLILIFIIIDIFL